MTQDDVVGGIVRDLGEIRRRLDAVSEKGAVAIDQIGTVSQQVREILRQSIEIAQRLATLEARSPEDTAAQLASIREQVRTLAYRVEQIDMDDSRASYKRAAGAHAASAERSFRGVLAVVVAAAATLSALLVELVRWLRGA